MGTVTGRITGQPMNSVAAGLANVGGIEEEFFVEGTATQFQLAGGASEYPTDGRWVAERGAAQQPFRTRLLVVRPSDPSSFNGTVIVNWNNVSSGEVFETPQRAAQLVKDGFALIGVSAQLVGVEGPPALPPELAERLGGIQLPGLKTGDPDRYESLHHPGDDYCYDIFTQAAELLGPDRPRELDPLDGFAVRHLVATGGSQSASRLGAYINGIQPLTSVFDAFLLLVFPNAPCALNSASAPQTLGAIGENSFALLPFYTYRLRDDLQVPVIVLNSEAEASDCDPNSQPDTEYLRWWEVPGTGHIGMVTLEEVGDQFSVPHSTVSFAPAVRGAFHALRHWLEVGEAPQHQPRLLKQGEPPVFPRDEHGNALGGIRWPDLEAPLGTHVAELFTRQGPSIGFGASIPFPPGKVRALYPDHAAWFAKYKDAVERLVERQVILRDDAHKMLARAEALELPK